MQGASKRSCICSWPILNQHSYNKTTLLWLEVFKTEVVGGAHSILDGCVNLQPWVVGTIGVGILSEEKEKEEEEED